MFLRVDGSELSHFLDVAWAILLDLILPEVWCVIPEPGEPFVEAECPLFLQAS
jgi:hypothetical protein